MSSLTPAQVSFSFEEFVRHGGDTGIHADGWGVAFYDGLDLRIVREPTPACDSACVTLLRDHPILSRIVISHVRKATQGELALHNTQPFQRELGGRVHVFAHNGHMPGIAELPALGSRRFCPIGTTDSEVAFCRLLHALAPLWDAGDPPPLADRFEAVRSFAASVAGLGPANFVYSDGEVVFAHAHRRTQADKEIKPPGMHLLTGAAAPPPGAGVRIDDGQRVTLVASVPLSDEPWRPLDEGTLLALVDGDVALEATTV